MNLEHSVDKVEDPVVGDVRARVRSGFASTRAAQARLRDLDNQ